MIRIYVEESDGNRVPLEVPTDVQISLMEVLKGYDYPVEATCGGMALCATCCIEVLDDQFSEATDPELDILDTLPVSNPNFRLACQMPVTEAMDGLVIRLATETSAY